MTSEREKVSNILLVAITRMGDMLQASPTIVGLKRRYPNARLTVAIEKNFSSICNGIPGIDEVYEIDLSAMCQCLHREREGIIDAYRLFSTVLEDLRARQYDFCLNMSSSGYTALLLKMLNIKDSRGWISDDEGFRLISNPWSMLFAAFVYHSNRDFNSINLVDIFRCSAEVKEHPNSLVYEVRDDSRKFVHDLLHTTGLTGSGPLIAVQAGASQEKRQWSPERFAKLARLLIENLNARLIFTGAKSELPIINRIFAAYNHPQMISAAGSTNLEQLAAILEASELLITGDTGPMHLSVAVGKPVVALFLASALCFETGPYSAGNIIVQPQVSCNPCNPNLPCSRPDCHDQVSPELIFELTKLRLEKSTSELVSGQISVPFVSPKEAIVYISDFDADNFLEFRSMNGAAERKGAPAEFYDAARLAYRSLWKHEFDAALPGNDPIRFAGIECPDAALREVRDVLDLIARGKELLTDLERLIRDISSPPRLLGEVSAALQAVDRALEDVGLSHRVLGAVIRMFIMEKENMRGDDPLVLASQMKGLYDTLRRRIEIFGSLFAYYLKSALGPAAFAQNISAQGVKETAGTAATELSPRLSRALEQVT